MSEWTQMPQVGEARSSYRTDLQQQVGEIASLYGFLLLLRIISRWVVVSVLGPQDHLLGRAYI